MTAAHVAVLRMLAQLREVDGRSAEIDTLAAAGLISWSGGHGKNDAGRWTRFASPHWRVTPAGSAALLFYELGREAATG